MPMTLRLWGYIGRKLYCTGSVVPWVHFKCSMQVLEDGTNLRIMDSDKNDGAQMSWCAKSFWILFFSSNMFQTCNRCDFGSCVCWCMLVSYFCCIFSLAGAVAHRESPRPLCHGARTFILIYISLAKILKSQGGGLIWQLFFGFLFFGRLVQAVDLHWFSTTSPFPFLSSPLLPLLHTSKITKNGRAAP